MNRSTTTLFLTLGVIAGIMGIEHGIGEVLQGPRPTESMFILSWPHAPFFQVMSGEPAMTVIPNYLVTGLFAILFSCLFLVVLLKPAPVRGPLPVLFALLVLMLLSGGGFGPPVAGMIALLVGLKRDSALRSWSSLPSRLHQVLAALWPWSFGLCLAGWLMLFPGAGLLAFLTGSDSALLMGIPLLFAFFLIPVTLVLGFSRDVLEKNSGAAQAGHHAGPRSRKAASA